MTGAQTALGQHSGRDLMGDRRGPLWRRLDAISQAQLPVDAWHEVHRRPLPSPSYPRARLVHNAHRLALDGPSMRRSQDGQVGLPTARGRARGYDGSRNRRQEQKNEQRASGPPMRGATFDRAVTSRRARAPPIALTRTSNTEIRKPIQRRIKLVRRPGRASTGITWSPCRRTAWRLLRTAQCCDPVDGPAHHRASAGAFQRLCMASAERSLPSMPARTGADESCPSRCAWWRRAARCRLSAKPRVRPKPAITLSARPSRQAARLLHLLGQLRGGSEWPASCNQVVGTVRYLVGGQRCLRGLDPQLRAGMIDQRHLCFSARAGKARHRPSSARRSRAEPASLISVSS